MATIAVTKSNIETKVLTSEKVILLEFWAKWCSSCRDMYSILDEVANERPDVLIGKVNVDYEPDLARKYGIVSIPTLVVIKNGKIAKKISGYQSKEDILDWI